MGLLRNKAYAPWTEWQVLGYYVAGPGEELEASAYPWGWEQPDYDDRKWEKAVRGMEVPRKDREITRDGCWFLARYLPMDSRIERLAQAPPVGRDRMPARISLLAKSFDDPGEYGGPLASG